MPPGGARWSADPFGGEVRDGVLYGRGACDMKGAVAAFVAAAAEHLAQGPPRGSISLLITGDEEGAAVDGTVRVLEWMAAHGQVPDFCLVGEPTNPARLGEVVKIGRRGSLNARIAVRGVQGHVAYPHRADNPVHRLVRALAALIAEPLDAGTAWFEPSALQITSADVGNRGEQRDPGGGESRAQHPVHRPAQRRLARALAARGPGAARGAVRTRRVGERRGLPDRAGAADRHATQRHRGRGGDRAAARHGRRHLGRALHRPLLPRGGVRAGGRDHASGGRAGAGGRAARRSRASTGR